MTHCVAGRFMPLGGGPACSWTRCQSRSRISRFDKLEKLHVARVVADGIEIGVVLEPRFHVGSDQPQIGLQQIDGTVCLPKQRINAGDVVQRVVVVRIDRQSAIRPFLGPLALAESDEGNGAQLRGI